MFVFRRDLRLADNRALFWAAEMAEEVLPCFVFDPAQADPEENAYFSAHSFQFMLESLEDLAEQLRDAGGKLYLFRGEPTEVVGELIGETEKDLVAVNRDYTPFSRERDGRLRELAAEAGAHFHSEDDALLLPPGAVKTNQGTPYRVFTPFWKAARERAVPEPAPGVPGASWVTEEIEGTIDLDDAWSVLPEPNEDLRVHGGRERALAILDRLGEHRDYQETRDVPADEEGTTRLSAHLKFGTVSAREVLHAIRRELGEDHGLARELWWRDFFTQLAWFHPWVLQGQPFRSEYAAIEWEEDDSLFDAWREGRTGFPLVDAGMRQLAATGFMHNRVRMLTASFLVKDLHIDWRRGERHFARHLVDYDPAVNNGNWQWAASTGADAQPFFRVFNPWRQQEKFDPECEYVKRWVPELRELEPEAIHGLENDRPAGSDLDYPEPVVDHRERAREAEEMFREAKE